jgi:hypothetical protein
MGSNVPTVHRTGRCHQCCQNYVSRKNIANALRSQLKLHNLIINNLLFDLNLLNDWIQSCCYIVVNCILESFEGQRSIHTDPVHCHFVVEMQNTISMTFAENNKNNQNISHYSNMSFPGSIFGK